MMTCKFCGGHSPARKFNCQFCSGNQSIGLPPVLNYLNGKSIQGEPTLNEINQVDGLLDKRLLQYKYFLNARHMKGCMIFGDAWEPYNRFHSRLEWPDWCTCGIYYILDKLESALEKVT